MAAKRPRSEDTYDDVMTCPVCTDEFKDPRILSCGHHFCYGCLEKIFKGKDGGSIRCPTCRHVTREEPRDLTKYKLNEFTAKVSVFINKKRPKIDKLCTECEKSTPAAWTCSECQVLFCDNCKLKHKTLESIADHKVTPISQSQFCAEHLDTFAVCICDTCHEFLCHRCVAQHEDTHSITSVKKAASLAKERLQAISLNSDSLLKDKVLCKDIKNAITKLKEENSDMNNTISEVEVKVKGLLEKVKDIKKQNKFTFQKELKELEILENDMSEFLQMKENLLKHVRELLDSASDVEIISREKEFPKYANDEVQGLINKFSVQIPNRKRLESFMDKVESVETCLNYSSDYIPIITAEEALQPMEIHSSFKLCSGSVKDLAYDPNNDTYVVRSSNAEKLIQVFDTSGKIIRTIGSKIQGIGRIGRIAIDTRRKLYLLPTADGKIVTINYEGQEQNVYDVNRFRLTGIAHCLIPKTGEDRYIVSSSKYDGDKEEASNALYVIDPENGSVLTEIKEDKNFPYPNFVTCFTLPNNEVRIAAGYLSGVKIYNLEGTVTNTIKGMKGAELIIRGISWERSPGILVCESDNNVIYNYTFDDEKTTLQKRMNLFNKEDLADTEPNLKHFWAIAYDWKNRRIVLSSMSRENRIFVLKEKK